MVWIKGFFEEDHEMEKLQSFCCEYWDHIRGRFGDLPISREDVKYGIIKYDIKDEMGYPGNSWQKMCCYQIADDGFDCDVARLTVLQYAIAYQKYVLSDGRKDQEQQGGYGIKWEFANPEKTELFKYRGDTMNSYNRTVHRYTGCWNESDILRRNAYYSARASHSALEFIRLRDTIGNFIPVPFVRQYKEFNRPRGTGSTNDYWDLALLAIYQWYTKQDDKALKEMLKNSDENTGLCKEWLREFGEGPVGWDTFVQDNYMEAFIAENSGAPKELWKGHFEEFEKGSDVLPSKQQCEEFFKNASMWILARGELIAEAIIQKLEETLGYDFWKKEPKEKR